MTKETEFKELKRLVEHLVKMRINLAISPYLNPMLAKEAEQALHQALKATLDAPAVEPFAEVINANRIGYEAAEKVKEKLYTSHKALEWYTFDSSKGSRQKHPSERKPVLVRMASIDPGCLPEGIAVGYRKNTADDKQSPYFVVPGLHTGTVLAWCDCLPDGFKWPNSMKDTEEICKTQ